MSTTLISIEAFLPDIETELPECPLPVVERRLRESLIESCERANLWCFEHPEVLVTQGIKGYDLVDLPDDTHVHSILSMKYRGSPIYANAHFHMIERGCVRLRREPKLDSSPLTDDPRTEIGLEATVTLKPTRECNEVSDVLFHDYHDLIVIGTLHRAWGMAGREWSSVDMSLEYRQRYEYALAKARQAIDRGFVTGSPQLMKRRFAASTRRGY